MGKNNYRLYAQKMQARRPAYTIKRLNISVASVLIGSVVGVSAMTTDAAADTVDTPSETELITPEANEPVLEDNETVTEETEASEDLATDVTPTPYAADTSADEAVEPAPLTEAKAAPALNDDDQAFVDAHKQSYEGTFTQTAFTIDENLDTNAEGYHVEITTDADNNYQLKVTGKDADGLFYGINDVDRQIEYNQLKADDRIESPAMPIRGVIEGFYGEPWSDQARKELFEFMGHNGMNTYIYSPKDDDLVRKQWRDSYTGEDKENFKSLVDVANKNHVDFVYVLSPGNDIEYTSDKDYQATIDKFESLRELGVSQFYIALDDIGAPLKGVDAEKYGAAKPGTKAYVAAQTDYLNRIQNEYLKPNNLPDLWIVPTDYAGTNRSEYKAALGEKLDPNIRIQWTGTDVFAPSITADQIEQAKAAYGSDHIFFWDNYPVNDQAYDRLFMRPIFHRDPALAGKTDGFTSNPMIEPYASWIAIKSYGDYAWASEKYDQRQSLAESILQIAGSDQDTQYALIEFTDLNMSWAPDRGTRIDDDWKAPILSQYVDAFIDAYRGDNEDAYQAAKTELTNYLNELTALPTTLQNLKVKGFYDDAEPWINAAAAYARQSLAVVDILDFDRHREAGAKLPADTMDIFNEAEQTAKAQTVKDRNGNQIPVKVGDGVFSKLVGLSRPIRNKLTPEDFAPVEDTDTPEEPEDKPTIPDLSGKIEDLTNRLNNLAEKLKHDFPRTEEKPETKPELPDLSGKVEELTNQLKDLADKLQHDFPQAETPEAKPELPDFSEKIEELTKQLQALAEKLKADFLQAEAPTDEPKAPITTPETPVHETLPTGTSVVKASEVTPASATATLPAAQPATATSQLPQTGIATLGLGLGLLLTGVGSAMTLKKRHH